MSLRSTLISSVALVWSGLALAANPSPAQMGLDHGMTPPLLDFYIPGTGWEPVVTTINLTSFGAKCDGNTDDTTAIKNWLSSQGTSANNFTLTAPAGVCVFSSPLSMPFATNYTVLGNGPKTTTFKYIGLDYNGTVTAGASWSAAATSINLTSAILPAHITAALNGSGQPLYPMSAWDVQSGAIKFIGRVASIIGATLTIQTPGAVFASAGSSDTVHLTTDLLTISDTAHGGEAGAAWRDFGIVSSTVLSGGYAFHFHGMFDTDLQTLWADDVNSLDATTRGNLCGGFWFDGVGGVSRFADPSAYSLQNCGDGILVNTALGGTAELLLFGGNIGGKSANNVVTGFTAGVHMAGGIGGIRCDSSNIHTNIIGWEVDQTVVATANREFDIGSTCALDSNQNQGLRVNDSGTGGPIDLAGWIGSTQQGPGVDIEAVSANTSIQLRGETIYDNCGDGVYNNSSNANYYISPGLSFRYNGHNLGSGCAAWQAAAGSGTGYGLNAATAPASAKGQPKFQQNVAGKINGTWIGLTLDEGVGYSAAGTALPTCNSAEKGYSATVIDANGPSYNATYSSGGSVTAKVICDGTNWVTQ